MGDHLKKHTLSIAFYLLAMGAQFSGFSNTYVALGLAAVATLLLATRAGQQAEEWVRNRKMEPSHLIWVGIIGAVVFVLVLATGALWSLRRGDTTPAPATASAQPPPPVAFVPRVPRLPTTADRDGFRAALGRLSAMLDELTTKIVITPDDIATSRPLAQPPHSSAVTKIAALTDRLQRSQTLDNQLFSSGEGPFFKDQPLYRAELLHLMPADTQQRWINYNVALRKFIDGLQVLKDAEGPPLDAAKFERAEKVAGFSQEPFNVAARELREWAVEVHRRIKATIDAIP